MLGKLLGGKQSSTKSKPAKKPAAKKPVTKKPATKKQTMAKKVATKKTATKKPVKKVATKKPTQKNTAKKTTTKKSTTKQPAKKSIKKAAPKKITAKKTTKKAATKKPTAKKSMAKKLTSTAAATQKPVTKKIEKPAIAPTESEMAAAYLPGNVEDRISARWDEAEIGKASGKAKSKAYTMMMPPPNVTGALHLGHAITLTIEDILARYQRAKGRDVLWLPGTDHAGIATQNVVEKQLAKQGLHRETLGREDFIKKVWEWKETYHARIVKQIKKIGASCDWSRERFTLDEGLSEAVTHAFVELYKKGLIYRDKKLVNWCPRCTTVLSDIEVDHREDEGKLYFIRYFVSATDKSVCVATTRPETMLGDTAVAVNPRDPRYSEYIGKDLILPIVNRLVKVVADERVDMKFGTGAVKITPAHDPLDAEIARDHKLPSIVVIGPHGKMTKHAGRFKGMSILEARENVVRYLDDIGNLEKIVHHKHQVGHCSRCDTVIEPLESLQWFVKMKPLAGKALKEVQKKNLGFIPDRFEKEFTGWMEEIRDWCVSRQLWWGHQLPVWYCKKVPVWPKKSSKKEGCMKVIVSKTEPKSCPHCGNLALIRDPDVLDTWFSSGIFPFSTLGWPKNTKDYQTFYPNAILETGRDILFFWVARMVTLGLQLTGKLPFQTVYLHGLVRDEQGRKMSKSLGNGIDPLDMCDRYGTDALRLALTVGATPGVDLKFSETKIAGQRNFVNKLWNASRFVLGKLGKKREIPARPTPRGLPDRWILSRLNSLIVDMTKALDSHAFGEAASRLQDFIWHDFCDWYLELSKDKPNLKVLSHVLGTVLRLAHPFVPFVTEQIWEQYYPVDPKSRKKPNLLAQNRWPTADKKLIQPKIEAEMELITTIISTIRSVRSELNVEPAKQIAAIIYADKNEALVKKHAAEIKQLARVSSLKVQKSGKEIEHAVAKFEAGLTIYLPLAKLLDPAEETRRLKRDLTEAENYRRVIAAKLENPDFVERAPDNIVEAEKAKLTEADKKITKIEERIAMLK